MIRHKQEIKKVLLSQNYTANEKNAFVIDYMTQTYPGLTYKFEITNNVATITLQR